MAFSGAVGEVQNLAKQYADSAMDSIETAVQDVSRMVEDIRNERRLTKSDMEYKKPALLTPLFDDLPTKPNKKDTTITPPPDKPEMGELRPISEVTTDDNVGVFEDPVPNTDAGEAPAPLEPFDREPPELDDKTKPPELPSEYKTPEEGQMFDIRLPDPPQFVEPDFSINFSFDEVDSTGLQGIEFSDSGEYESDILDTLKETISFDIQYGTYGINTEVEPLIWERAREREMALFNAEVDRIARESAAKGFDLPDGVYLSMVESARQDMLEKSASLSREVAIKRADMYVEGRKLTIEQAMKLESMLIQKYTTDMERALKTVVSIAEVNIALYNARVSQLNTRMEIAKTELVGYEARVKAALVPLEAYKSALESKKLIGELNNLEVQTYSARVRAVELLIGADKAKIDLYTAKLNGEKIKVDVFRSQVEAFSAKAQSKSMELEAYKARIDAKTSAVRAFEAKAGAFNAKANAYRARVDADKTKVEADVAYNDGLIKKYIGEVERYKTEYEAEIKKATANVEIYRSEIEAWGVEADRMIKKNSTQADKDLQHNQTNMQEAIAKVEAARRVAEISLKYMELALNSESNLVDKNVALVGGYLSQISGISANIESASV